MEENVVILNSPKAWLLAARPKTLTGAAVPVMIGLSLACADVGWRNFNLVPAALCLLFAFIMQIDANFINDYFDYLKGNDDDTRLGPLRACAQGWISVKAMFKGIVFTTVLACVVGLPLVLYGGLAMIVVGALCVVFCFLYTTKLSYLGLGDVLVLVFFGVVPVCLTYYLQSATVTLEVFLASLACGFVIDTLLIVNNYRDIDNDRRAGKFTLMVKVGARTGRRLYFVSGLLAMLIGVMYLFNGRSLAFILPMIYLFMHCKTYRKLVRINKGKALNHVLADNSRNMFMYGLLVSLGLLLS